jgi:3-deoxy-D-manno-octulosonic-acid transferase
MYFLYSLFLGLALVITAPFLLLRKKHRVGLRERLGVVPERIQGNPGNPNIWIHAVSVGEVLAIHPLVEELRRRLPSSRVFVSTTTATGQALAHQRFGEKNVFFFPLDLPVCLRPYLRSVNPALMVLAETELWPNLLQSAKRTGARLAVVNTRISDRSVGGYRRWRLLLRHPLSQVDLFLAQTVEDAKRLVLIGVPQENIQVTGNLKFDVAVPAELPVVHELSAALTRGGATSLIVCGSTVASPSREGSEEELLLRAFKRVLETHPAAVMVLAPRKPERFERVAARIESFSLPMWRRLHLGSHQAIAGGVVLLDTIGELASLYQLATFAFIGGSLVPAGGHNILEPAQAGVPILVGPHTQNFRDIVQIFRKAEALIVMPPRPQEMADRFLQLLNNEELRVELGTRARQVFESQAGATIRTADALLQLLEEDLAVEAAEGAGRRAP